MFFFKEPLPSLENQRNSWISNINIVFPLPYEGKRVCCKKKISFKNLCRPLKIKEITALEWYGPMFTDVARRAPIQTDMEWLRPMRTSVHREARLWAEKTWRTKVRYWGFSEIPGEGGRLKSLCVVSCPGRCCHRYGPMWTDMNRCAPMFTDVYRRWPMWTDAPWWLPALTLMSPYGQPGIDVH